jgi:hypothetical protein
VIVASVGRRHSIRWGRCVLIALGVIVAINILAGPRQRPLSPSAEVPRFSDLPKRPGVPSSDHPHLQPENSLVGQAFNRALFAVSPPEPDTLVFGARVVVIDASLIHVSNRGRAAGFIRALERWTAEPCTNTRRRIAAANVNQFIHERRRLLALEPPPAPEAKGAVQDPIEPVWRGDEGRQMRNALLDYADGGRLALAHFGDYPPEEVLSIFSVVPEKLGVCQEG